MSEYEGLKQEVVNQMDTVRSFCSRLDPYFPQGRVHLSTVLELLRRSLDAIRTLEERVGELERDLAEGLKEAEQLEYLESIMDEDLEYMHRGVVYFRILLGPIECGGEIHRNSDLSAAIDATRESEGDGPEDLDYPPTPAERLEMADRARRVK